MYIQLSSWFLNFQLPSAHKIWEVHKHLPQNESSNSNSEWWYKEVATCIPDPPSSKSYTFLFLNMSNSTGSFFYLPDLFLDSAGLHSHLSEPPTYRPLHSIFLSSDLPSLSLALAQALSNMFSAKEIFLQLKYDHTSSNL